MVSNTTGSGPTAPPAAGSGIVIGTDRVLGQTGNWAAASPQQLYDAVHVNTDPSQCYVHADQWTRLGADMSDQTSLMVNQVHGSAAGWQGSAADAARSALSRLATWSQQTSSAVGAVGQRLHSQADIVATAQANMPQPVQVDVNQILNQGLASGGVAGLNAAVQDVKVRVDQANAAHAQAVQVMTTMESSSRQIDGNVPTFVPPPATVRSATAPNLPNVSPLTPRLAGRPTGPGPVVTSPSGVAHLPNAPVQGSIPSGPGTGVPSPAAPLLPAASINTSNPSFNPNTLTSPPGVGPSSNGPGGNPGSFNPAAVPQGTTPQWVARSQGGPVMPPSGTPYPSGGTPSGQQPTWSNNPGANSPYNLTTQSAGPTAANPPIGPGNLPSMQNPYSSDQISPPGSQQSPNWMTGNGPSGTVPPGGLPGGYPGSSESTPPGMPGSSQSNLSRSAGASGLAGKNAMFGAGGTGMGGAGIGGAAAAANLGKGLAGAGGAMPGQGATSGALPGEGGGAAVTGKSVGATGPAGAAGQGSSPMMGGGGQGGRGQDDAEHKNKYADESDGLFAVPDADRLPPSVIGEKRTANPRNETPGT